MKHVTSPVFVIKGVIGILDDINHAIAGSTLEPLPDVVPGAVTFVRKDGVRLVIQYDIYRDEFVGRFDASVKE